jgi:hypothetical protein
MKRKLGKIKERSPVALEMILRTGNHAGKHHNRDWDVVKGKSRKQKHKKNNDY